MGLCSSEQTLDKIKQFAIAVEKHHEPNWNMETGKEEVGSVTDGCQQLTVWLKESARYEELRRNLILNPDNKATVVWDFTKRDIVIVN